MKNLSDLAIEKEKAEDALCSDIARLERSMEFLGLGKLDLFNRIFVNITGPMESPVVAKMRQKVEGARCLDFDGIVNVYEKEKEFIKLKSLGTTRNELIGVFKRALNRARNERSEK